MVIYSSILYYILLFLWFLLLDYPPNGRGIVGGLDLFNTKICHYADFLYYLCGKFMFNLIYWYYESFKKWLSGF